jgi:hypothetical protein
MDNTAAYNCTLFLAAGDHTGLEQYGKARSAVS